MKFRFFLSLSLLAWLLTACAPEVSSPPAASTPTIGAGFPSPVGLPTTDSLAATITPFPTTDGDVVVPTMVPPPVDAIPVATSRGPDLEATDPLTVSLASGQLHFVEFFRFT